MSDTEKAVSQFISSLGVCLQGLDRNLPAPFRRNSVEVLRSYQAELSLLIVKIEADLPPASTTPKLNHGATENAEEKAA